MGHAWSLQGEHERAREVLRAVLEAAGASADQAVLSSARQELLRVLLQAGELPEARRVAERLAEAELWWPRWSGLLSLAAIEAQAGDLAQARQHLEAAQAVIEEGDEAAGRRALARTYLLSNRVTVALIGGDYALAAQHNERLRDQAAAAEGSEQLRESELNRAVIALRRGHLSQAREGLQRLGEWAVLVDDQRLRALTQAFSSELLLRSGNVEGARQRAQLALDEATRGGQPHAQVEAALALGQAYQAAARTEEARYQWQRAADQAAKLHLRRLELQARLLLAEADSAADTNDVLEHLCRSGVEDLLVDAVVRGGPEGLKAAAEQAGQLGYFWGEHAALLRLADLDLGRGETDEAARLAQARTLSQTIGAGEYPTVEAAEAEMAARLADAV